MSLESIFKNLSNKTIVISQYPFVIVLGAAVLNIVVFGIKSIIFGPSLYNNIHFIMSFSLIFIIVVFILESKSREIFLTDLTKWHFSYINLPVWLVETLEYAPNARFARRYYWLGWLFFIDGFIMVFKILFFGCKIYARIHFAIVVIGLIWIYIALKVFSVQIHFNRKMYPRIVASCYPFVALLKRKPVLLEQHPFHILPPSVLPFLTAFFTFDFLFFVVKYMHYGWSTYISMHFTISITGLILVLSYWFFSINQEADAGFHTKKVRWNLLHGVMLFIVSEIMLFFSIFWAFFHSSLAPTVAIYCTWPPIGIEVINPWALPLLNTVILLSSGVSLTFAHRALSERDFTAVSRGLLITLFYGFIFTAIQLFEYIHAPFSINDSIYGSIFFLSTGFHGLHVIIGTIMLLVTLLRNGLRQIYSTQHIGFLTAAWYWHFVDVVWLFLFISIYWWGS